MFPPTGHFIAFQSSQLHYHLWGTGPAMLFAFHGYGEAASSFAFIGEALDSDHTLIAIDLPFHGQTQWREGLSFTPRQLFEVMEAIAARHHPADPGSIHPSARRGPWGLIGYSMGGRIALQLVENHPEQFTRLILLAPDGLKVNFWYRIATQTSLGNLLFRRTMRRPGWLFFLLRLSHALRLANPGIYKFALHQIDDRQVRQDLYTRWTAMRKFKPRLAATAAVIRRQQLPVILVYGKYDRIIRWETGEKFRHRGTSTKQTSRSLKLADLCRLVLLDTGHQLLRPQFLPLYLQIISVPK